MLSVRKELNNFVLQKVKIESGHPLEEREENHENLSQDKLFLNLDLNQVSAEQRKQ
jgi:hypothetical protein